MKLPGSLLTFISVLLFPVLINEQIVVSSASGLYQDTSRVQSLISEVLPGSKIIKTTHLTRFDAVEWVLSNNAKVIYRKAEYEKDNVILASFSLGGTSQYEIDMLPSAAMLSDLIGMYGLGDFDYMTLQKKLAGREASASVILGEITESINGSSTPEDFELMMQLLYLRFSKPRFDQNAHNEIILRYDTFLRNMANDPSKIMQDSLSLFLTNFNPRTIIINNELLRKVELEKISKICTERFRNASDFIFIIVGNVEELTVKPMVEKYIGSIASGTGRETFIDREVRSPKGKFVREVQIPYLPAATVFLSHSNSFIYNSYNNVCLKVINVILKSVLTDRVRKESGGTHSVSVSLSSQLYPYQNAQGLIMFDCEPAKAETLKAIIYDQIDSLMKVGPTKENLGKAVGNMLKNREESKLHNNYWSNAIYSWYYTGVDVNDPKNYEKILKKLSVKDIQKAAKSFYGNADVADIVFRPKNQ
jgi:zinc protease